MSPLHLRDVQMMPKKIILQKYLKITKGMKNVRNPHILRTLPILHFFDALKFFWDLIWLGYCLNEFITHKGCSNNDRKIILQKYLKIRKGTKNVRNPHILRTLPIIHFFDALNFFLDFIWLGYYLNKFITLMGCSNDAWKNQTPNILKI